MNYKAVVFDRDDTLTHDVNWTYKLEDFRLLKGASQAIKFCNQAGLLVFVATNQGGIGKGLYTVQDMHRFHWRMKHELALSGAWIDDIVYCPHYPYPPGDDRACACRKPNPGLLSLLFSKWELRPSEVLMIGDKQTDIDAATRAGAAGALFDGDDLMVTLQNVMKK